MRLQEENLDLSPPSLWFWFFCCSSCKGGLKSPLLSVAVANSKRFLTEVRVCFLVLLRTLPICFALFFGTDCSPLDFVCGLWNVILCLKRVVEICSTSLPAVIPLALKVLQCGSSWRSTPSVPCDVKAVSCVEPDGESQIEIKVPALAALQGVIYGGSSTWSL